MGPISFDKIRVGRDRGRALEAARRVAEAGIRLDLIEPNPAGPDSEFYLMVRSASYLAARSLIDDPESE